MRRALPALAAAALLASCGGRAPVTSPAPGSSTNAASPASPQRPAPSGTGPTQPAPGKASPGAPPPPSPTAPPRLRLVPVAALSRPLAMAVAPGDPALFFAEKGGLVRAVRSGRVEAGAVLDLSGAVSGGSEQGLLGLAFAPGGGFMYVNFTNRSGDTVVREYRFADGTADASSARDLLEVSQPFANHNGGNLVFGPDGRLWIGLGDGGSGGDPRGNAQSLSTLLGKMLRIDVRAQGDAPYGIPPDNPFVGRPGVRSEIYAYGLRNPWRYSFDRATGDLWIGDVGQNRVEEIDRVAPGEAAGANFGWNRLEGSRPFRGEAPADSVAPVYEYRLGGGRCAVTGGYVYRGTALPHLAGTYVFADFCAGRLEGLAAAPGGGLIHRLLGPRSSQVASFGEDGDGELYVLSLEGPVFRLGR